MITQIENDLIEKNRDKLLRILLEKEYKDYLYKWKEHERKHYQMLSTEFKRKKLEFYEWMEELLSK